MGEPTRPSSLALWAPLESATARESFRARLGTFVAILMVLVVGFLVVALVLVVLIDPRVLARTSPRRRRSCSLASS